MGDISTKSRYFINDWCLGQIVSFYSCNYGENFHRLPRHAHRQRIALWVISPRSILAYNLS